VKKAFYEEDLAFIHAVGHSNFALNAAAAILEALSDSGINEGLVVDLGCGNGIWASKLIAAGYDVLGIDISEAMIELARQQSPQSEFRIDSIFKAKIPSCRAVTPLGECLNYLFDSRNTAAAQTKLFRRIYRALKPGGLFVFDVAEPGQVPPGTVSKGFSEGDQWFVAVEKEEDRKRAVLTRRIISFRRIDDTYRRAEEVHQQRLYRAGEVAQRLREAGFQVRMKRNYGAYALQPKHAAFFARKKD